MVRTSRQATYVFNLVEADRYEQLVEYEGRQVRVFYGRAAGKRGDLAGELVCVAYPLDSVGRELVARLVVREDDGVHHTVSSSSVRRIVLRCVDCGGNDPDTDACCGNLE